MNSITEIVALPHPGKLLLIEPLDYPNPYDFHAPHRHDYFEIILIKSGSGSQIIDFNRYNLEQYRLFNIYPGQVHLMDRGDAQGLIIQFRKNLFDFIHPIKHFQLYFSRPEFVLEEKQFENIYNLAKNIRTLVQTEQLTPISIHKAYSYLQIILITLIELYGNTLTGEHDNLAIQFLALVTQHLRVKKKVSDYCDLLNCSAAKLNTACKNSLGKTSLSLIHEEIILEIRRLLLLNEMSLKEIAYDFNFDGQANFSNFIKANTGMTPTELQQHILQIYKQYD